MHCIMVTSNRLGNADIFEVGEWDAGIGLPAVSIMVDAGMNQLRFAYAKEPC